jgi:hypothetical protein
VKNKKKIKRDIKRYERQTGNEFRTAHKWSGKFYDHKVTNADVEGNDAA